eukprot:9488380-Pyramimonas_sp.AAC.1
MPPRGSGGPGGPPGRPHPASPWRAASGAERAAPAEVGRDAEGGMLRGAPGTHPRPFAFLLPVLPLTQSPPASP